MNNTQLYNIWSNMKQRCKNHKRPDYKYYGGKGINYFEKWEMYSEFERWALNNGFKEGLTLDRKDFTKGYYPGNCRFITLEEQQRNKSNNLMFSYNGITKTLSEWAREYGIHFRTLKSRLELGYTFEEALNKEKGVNRTSKFYIVDGNRFTLTQLANKCGMSKACLYQRLKRGWSLEQSINTNLKNTKE